MSLDLKRYIRAGANLALSLENFSELRKSYTINGNPAVVSGGPWGNRVIKFDGTGDYIDLNQPPDLNFTGYTSFTISCWIKANSWVNYGGIISNSIGGGTTTIRIGLALASTNNGQLRLDLGDGTNYNSPSSAASEILVNNWYYIVVVVNGNGSSNQTTTFYINGRVSGTPLVSTRNLATSTVSWNIGRNYNSSLYGFNGSISEILIFPRALIAAEVQSLYNGTTFNYMDNLVSAYDFSEINPQDISPNGRNHATGTSIVVGNIVSGQNSRFKALDLDGTNDFITVPTSSNLNFGTSDFSILCWVKFDTVGTDQVILSKKSVYTGNTAGYVLYKTNTNVISARVATGSANTSSVGTTVLIANRWYLMSFVRNGDSLMIYLDALLQDTDTGISAYDITSSDDLIFGKDTSGNGDLNGQIGYSAIYNYALTNLQIKDIYEKQK